MNHIKERIVPVAASQQPSIFSSSLLAAIVESSEDAIISKDLNGIVTTWNQAACRVFGYSAEKMIGQPILRIIPAELAGEEAAILMRLRAGEKIERFETRRLHEDGRIIELSMTISPIRDASGRIVGAAKIARDISERKRMERQLSGSESLAAAGRMASAVAQEINGPLETVMNLVYLARRSSPKWERAHSYLLSAEGELDRVAQIIRRLFSFYSEIGCQSEVYLQDVLTEALAVYQPQLHAIGVTIDCRYEGRCPVAANGIEFAHVFANIVSGVLHVMPQGGNLAIDVKEAAGTEYGGICVSVCLHALGMQSDLVERTFRPLVSERGTIGDDLGLALARELLQKRGAQITFKSGNTSVDSNATIGVFVPFS